MQTESSSNVLIPTQVYRLRRQKRPNIKLHHPPITRQPLDRDHRRATSLTVSFPFFQCRFPRISLRGDEPEPLVHTTPTILARTLLSRYHLTFPLPSASSTYHIVSFPSSLSVYLPISSGSGPNFVTSVHPPHTILSRVLFALCIIAACMLGITSCLSHDHPLTTYFALFSTSSSSPDPLSCSPLSLLHKSSFAKLHCLFDLRASRTSQAIWDASGASPAAARHDTTHPAFSLHQSRPVQPPAPTLLRHSRLCSPTTPSDLSLQYFAYPSLQ
jgi:hypothetical protein